MATPLTEDASQETISSGLSMKGELQFTGPALMNGRLEGAIRSMRKILVGPIGWIKGRVECAECEIKGKVYGELQAQGKVTIHPQAVCRGAIKAGALAIHAGSEVKGTVDVRHNKLISASYERPSGIQTFWKRLFGAD